MSPDMIAQQVARIGRERDCAQSALRRLVSLKAHKETHGKTDWYDREREAAWAQARAAIGIGEPL